MSLNLFASSDDLLALTIVLKVRPYADRGPRIRRTEQRQDIPAGFSVPGLPNLGVDQILGGLDGYSPVLPCKDETFTR